jgi:acetyl esterase/lipase
LLTALNDMILPHTFLKVCANAYLGEYQQSAESNPFISPINTSDSILAQYPPTEIFVGNKDPFHDDCCRFIERLTDLNKNDNHLTIF